MALIVFMERRVLRIVQPLPLRENRRFNAMKSISTPSISAHIIVWMKAIESAITLTIEKRKETEEGNCKGTERKIAKGIGREARRETGMRHMTVAERGKEREIALAITTRHHKRGFKAKRTR